MRKARKMCNTITGIARKTLNARTAKGARRSAKGLTQYGNSFALAYLRRLLLKTRTQKGIRHKIGKYTRAFNRACTDSALRSLMST